MHTRKHRSQNIFLLSSSVSASGNFPPFFVPFFYGRTKPLLPSSSSCDIFFFFSPPSRIFSRYGITRRRRNAHIFDWPKRYGEVIGRKREREREASHTQIILIPSKCRQGRFSCLKSLLKYKRKTEATNRDKGPTLALLGLARRRVRVQTLGWVGTLLTHANS